MFRFRNQKKFSKAEKNKNAAFIVTNFSSKKFDDLAKTFIEKYMKYEESLKEKSILHENFIGEKPLAPENYEQFDIYNDSILQLAEEKQK